MSQPTDFHWLVVERLNYYVNGTLHHCLLMTLSTLNLVVLCDGYWGNCFDYRKGTIVFPQIL